MRQKNYFSLVLAFCSLLLGGCAAAVLAGGAAGGSIINDKRSLKTIESDYRVSHELGMALTRDKALKTSHLVVSSFEHMVFLGGEVPKASLKSYAERVVLKHPKVRRVYNQIQVAPNNSLKQQAIDAWVTANVKGRMLAKSGLHAGSIKVITENGVVYLMGRVGRDQANMAVDIARRVDNVKKVVKLFNYAD